MKIHENEKIHYTDFYERFRPEFFFDSFLHNNILSNNDIKKTCQNYQLDLRDNHNMLQHRTHFTCGSYFQVQRYEKKEKNGANVFQNFYLSCNTRTFASPYSIEQTLKKNLTSELETKENKLNKLPQSE